MSLCFAADQIPLLMLPMKAHHTIEEYKRSKRVESVRKDIECCLARLKGRWRLFKKGILFVSREKIDNTWLTACILHNMLHKRNGLDKIEEVSDWVGSAGAVDHDLETHSMIGANCDPPSNGFQTAREASNPLEVLRQQEADTVVQEGRQRCLRIVCECSGVITCCNTQWRHAGTTSWCWEHFFVELGLCWRSQFDDIYCRKQQPAY